MGPGWPLLWTAELWAWLVHRAQSLWSRCIAVASACSVCGH